MKKRDKQRYYTRKGKLLARMLYLLSTSVVMALLTVLMYCLYMFGGRIVTEPELSYYQTPYYYSAIENDISQMLLYANTAKWNSAGKNCSIIDLGKQRIHCYDLKAVMEAYSNGENPVELEQLNVYDKYIVEHEELNIEEFSDYKLAYDMLNRYKGQNAYIYLTQEDFANLILEKGIPNTDYCISTRFPQTAYFLFTYIQQGAEFTEEISLSDGAGFSVAIEENAETEEIYLTDSSYPELDSVGYLVYDPEEKLFFSPWDDYFDAMDTYIYSVDELLDMIQERKVTADNTESMLFPMIWSVNYDVSSVFFDMVAIQEEMEDIEQMRQENTGLSFYVEEGKNVWSNVDSKEEILSLPEYYKFTTDKVISTNCKFAISDAFSDDIVQDRVQEFPKGTTFLVGIDEKNTSAGDMNSSCRGFACYSFFMEYEVLIFAGICVGLVLCILLNIHLLRVTGRTGGEDKAVKLHLFDRLPIEIWLAVICVVTGITIGCGITGAQSIRFMEQVEMGIIMLCGTAVTFPFIFFLTEFELSFARRLKAHNLLQNILVVRCVKGFRTGIHKEIQEMTGVQQLSTFVVSYMAANLLLVIFLVVNGFGNAIEGVFVAVLLEVILQVVYYRIMRHYVRDSRKLVDGVKQIKEGNLKEPVAVNAKTKLFQEMADGINHISDGLQAAVETSIKDERMRTELITNVSHDLKTPLTSIINYIDLLKTQSMPTPEAEHYVEVLEAKAQRLRHLTEDLVEAAKATSGNIELEMMPLAFDELMKQSVGEFEDKYAAKNLTLVTSYPERKVMIMADGRRMYRVIENVLQNAYKYSLEGTRVYADLKIDGQNTIFTLKNISKAELNISADELMERFTRGDSARSTEGSGLGLSIAKDLTRLQGGTFSISLDGDLFKVSILFPEYKESTHKEHNA